MNRHIASLVLAAVVLTSVSISAQGKPSTAYSELKKYSSPIPLLVGPVPGDKWLIFEEISESEP